MSGTMIDDAIRFDMSFESEEPAFSTSFESDDESFNSAFCDVISDYSLMVNKPKLNSVEIVGNKVSSDFGIANASDLTAHTGNVSNPHGVTKAQVGLGNVDNTSDLNKPISVAVQSALDTKASGADLVSHTGDSAIHVTVSDKSAWSGKYDKPVSGIPKSDLTASVQTSLGKADSAYQKALSGIPKLDLSSDVQTSLGKADTALQSAALNPYRPASEQNAIDCTKYVKPAGGIPKSDFSSSVQASLSLADSALQSHQSLSAYRTSAAQDVIDSAKADLVNGTVPAAQLPSYVDDVLEYATLSAFPAVGESGKIYIDLSDNKTYRWGGSTYVVISEGVVIGETASTAFAGSRGVALESAVSSHTADTVSHVTSADKTSWSDKYDLPSGGVPKTDLASGVQASLDLADSALQSHQSLSAYRTSAAQDVIDATKASVSDLTTHTGNTTVHITSAERSAWDAKYDLPSGGTTDQVLTKTASGTAWSDAPSGLPTITVSDEDKVLTVEDGEAVWAESSGGSGVTQAEKNTWNSKMDGVASVTLETGSFAIGSVMDNLLEQTTSEATVINLTNSVSADANGGKMFINACNDAGATIQGFQIVSGTVPTLGTENGRVGDVMFDTDFMYVCVAANSWKKIALSAIAS